MKPKPKPISVNEQRVMYCARLGNIDRALCEILPDLPRALVGAVQDVLTGVRKLTRDIELDSGFAPKQKPFHRNVMGSTALARARLIDHRED